MMMNAPVKRVCTALGLTKSQVMKVDVKINFPSLRQPGKSKKSKNIKRLTDSFDEQVIRNTIHECHNSNACVTMPRLHAMFEKKNIKTGCIRTLERTVKRMGFRFYKNGIQKRFSKERTKIVSWRHAYLRTIKKYRQHGRHIVYLDETWVNANHSWKGEWSENIPGTTTAMVSSGCSDCGRCIPEGKGKRLIVLDAGSREMGFIPDVGLVFLSKTNSQDYHDEMNAKHFTEWFKDILLPKLPPSSVVVMDNASYHSEIEKDTKPPVNSSKVQDIKKWLEMKEIAYEEGMKKTELLDLVRKTGCKSQYVIDKIARDNGHEVLRLPPRHCELNPIELIWAQLKNHVAKENNKFQLKGVLNLFHESKSLILKENWEKAVAHVEKVEEALCEQDGVQENEIDKVVVCLDDDSESETETDCMDCESCYSDTFVLDDDDDDDDVPCALCLQRDPPYVGHGSEVDWVQCDMCDRWMHEVCSGRKGRKGCFACKHCLKIISVNHVED